MAKLSTPQARRLLKFYLTGDPGGGAWSTMQILAKKGMVTLDKRVTITSAGRAWCDDNHLNYTVL